ncbi:MAG TPA: thiamine phosphate synthase [Burkholderiales bacterium]|nr:thiamine phosphate synthase [Burkholderiales bacterium]
MKRSISGLYAITPDTENTPALLQKVEAALSGGARLLQYRNKTASASLRLTQGRALLALCEKFQVPLIINDHLELALALDAHLHVGGEDGSASEARRQLGPDKILGVSCYSRLDSAVTAVSAGATYVAFGGFYPSKVKPGANARTSIKLLGEAKRLLDVPVVAIGGITLDNAPALVAAGADSVAVITALFEAPEIRDAARSFDKLFPRKS